MGIKKQHKIGRRIIINKKKTKQTKKRTNEQNLSNLNKMQREFPTLEPVLEYKMKEKNNEPNGRITTEKNNSKRV